MKKNIIITILLMCISPCFADWYMVTSKNARFYDKNGKARGILFEGQVVEAIRHKWDRDLIHLKHKGKIYQAHKKDFKRELELLSELEDENLTAEASLTDLSRELELNFERLCLIIEAQKQATRDRSFYYPLDVEKHVDSETREVTFETVYMPVIDKTAYRELHQKWEDEEKKLRKRIDLQRIKRRQHLMTLSLNALKKSHYQEAFMLAQKMPEIEDYKAFITISPEARLYQDGKVRVFLEKDDLVIARFNPETKLLRVYRKGRFYLTRDDYFKSFDELTEDFYKKKIDLQDRILNLEADMKVMLFKRKMLYRLLVDLNHKSAAGAAYIAVLRQRTVPGRHKLFNIKYQIANPVFHIHSRRASAVAKAWQEELDEMKDDAAKVRKEHLKLQRELRDLQGNFDLDSKRLGEFLADFRKSVADRKTADEQ